ncbi:LysR family transcriptional regulator [Corallincola luteus]|uniref:LysR family transcriptional regulator n=1 Tax=Corallincola luteus TaxID=1775177 RepID=A0ABY2APM7_9GAMM|nr:LysR family transcriptional regulator [Corallincola luteus]TCI05149.1 LysR family transcriptional regulator [Corallincola luteus]
MNKDQSDTIYWSGIRAFIAVCEHGSFSAAAEATHASKSNLSQQVSTLEQTLGVQLLFRTTRQLRLTEVGERYLAMCQQGVAQLSSASEWAVQNTEQLSGTIRMNAVGGVIGEELIAPLLIKFQQQYPAINVKLDFSSQRVDLLSSPYDLVMRMGELADSSLIARRLHTISTRYVASKAFVEQNGPLNHPNDLKRCSLIYGSVNEWRFNDGQSNITIVADHGFQITNGRVMLKAALAGQGIARLADIYVQSAITRGDLVEVLQTWHPADTPLSLVSPPTRHQLYRVKTLMDFLVCHFKDSYDAYLAE